MICFVEQQLLKDGLLCRQVDRAQVREAQEGLRFRGWQKVSRRFTIFARPDNSAQRLMAPDQLGETG